MVHQILVWVLFTIPEGLMMVIAGLGFLGVRRSLRQIAPVGLIVGTVIIIARSLLPLGYHILLAGVVYCILTVLVLKVSVKSAIVALFVSAFLTNLGQALIVVPILKATGLSIEDVLYNVWLHIGFGWLSDIMLLAATIFVIVRKHALIPIPE